MANKLRYAPYILLYPLTALVLFGQSGGGEGAAEGLTTFEIVMLVLFAPLLARFLVGFSIALWHPLVERARARRRPADWRPRVSVLIPAWNEEVGIAAAMRSVLAADYPDLELIVIDDGSSDGTLRQIARVAADPLDHGRGRRRSIAFRRVRNGGKARALNVALGIARGEIVVTIDADSSVHPQAIANMVKHFADPGVAAVAGNVAIGNRDTYLGLLQQLEYLFGFYFKRAEGMLDAVYIVGGAAAAYRRTTLVEAGGFDEAIITEDIELSTRLQALGFKVRYAADATVFTEGPADFASLCRQRLRWKYGRTTTFLRYKSLFFGTKPEHNRFLTWFVLPVTVYCEFLLLVAPVLITMFYAHAFATGSLGAMSFVIVIAGVVTLLLIASDQNLRHHRNLVLLAPVAWVAFHLVDVVEHQALLRSLRRLAAGEGLAWQRWSRRGVFGGDRASPALRA